MNRHSPCASAAVKCLTLVTSLALCGCDALSLISGPASTHYIVGGSAEKAVIASATISSPIDVFMSGNLPQEGGTLQIVDPATLAVNHTIENLPAGWLLSFDSQMPTDGDWFASYDYDEAKIHVVNLSTDAQKDYPAVTDDGDSMIPYSLTAGRLLLQIFDADYNLKGAAIMNPEDGAVTTLTFPTLDYTPELLELYGDELVIWGTENTDYFGEVVDETAPTPFRVNIINIKSSAESSFNVDLGDAELASVVNLSVDRIFVNAVVPPKDSETAYDTRVIVIDRDSSKFSTLLDLPGDPANPTAGRNATHVQPDGAVILLLDYPAPDLAMTDLLNFVLNTKSTTAISFNDFKGGDTMILESQSTLPEQFSCNITPVRLGDFILTLIPGQCELLSYNIKTKEKKQAYIFGN